VCVADPCSSERFFERVRIELRAVARFGYRPDVHDFLDAVILQGFYEFIHGTS
jgi:hypothetical protein